MKAAIRRLFGTFGYQLIPTRPAASYKLKSDELADLQQIRDAVNQAPGEHTGWMSSKKVSQYLSADRIWLYQLVLDRCEQHSIAFDGKEVADVGSGPAFLFRLLRKRANLISLVGYDASSSVNCLAAHVCPEAQIINQDLFAVQDVAYDVVFCMEVLEHLRKPHLGLKKLCELVRSGGHLVLTVPNGRFDHMPAGEVFDHEQAYKGHVNFWSPESWPEYLEAFLPNRDIYTELLPSGHNFAIIGPGES